MKNKKETLSFLFLEKVSEAKKQFQKTAKKFGNKESAKKPEIV